MRISWKSGFTDKSLAWSRSKEHNRIKKHKKHNAMAVASPQIMQWLS